MLVQLGRFFLRLTEAGDGSDCRLTRQSLRKHLISFFIVLQGRYLLGLRNWSGAIPLCFHKSVSGTNMSVIKLK